MTDFFAGFEEFEAERKQQSQQNYDARMLLKLLTCLDKDQAKLLKREAGDEFGFTWFNESMGPPMRLHARKLRKVSYDTFFKKQLKKTELGEAFFDVMDSYGKFTADVGLVFPIVSSSNWIIYSGTLVPVAPRVPFVEVRTDLEEAPPIRIMRFDDFIQGFRSCYAL